MSTHVSMSSQHFFVMKKCLTIYLTSDLKTKDIEHSNVVADVENVINEVNCWLNEVSTLEGDSIMILGDLGSEWKYFTTKKITEIVDDLLLKIENNSFYSLILMCLSSCVGEGLDCSDARFVVRDGFLTSMLDFV